MRASTANIDSDLEMDDVSSEAKPQIYHAIKYLADNFVRLIPTVACPQCNDLITNSMPELAVCGHWLHYQCFKEIINLPIL